MTEAEKLLHMIEAVAPYDREDLDEIDARFYCFYKNLQYRFDKRTENHSFINPFGGLTRLSSSRVKKYTRSRDALKEVRESELVGWFIKLESFRMENACTISTGPVNEKSFKIKLMQTEELVELYAIIQAINYQRSKND